MLLVTERNEVWDCTNVALRDPFACVYTSRVGCVTVLLRSLPRLVRGSRPEGLPQKSPPLARAFLRRKFPGMTRLHTSPPAPHASWKATSAWYLKVLIVLSVYVPLFVYMMGFDMFGLGISSMGWARAGLAFLAGAMLQSFSFCVLHDASHYGLFFKVSLSRASCAMGNSSGSLADVRDPVRGRAAASRADYRRRKCIGIGPLQVMAAS